MTNPLSLTTITFNVPIVFFLHTSNTDYTRFLTSKISVRYICLAHLLTHVRIIFLVHDSGITNVSVAVAVVPSLSFLLGHHCVTISAAAGSFTIQCTLDHHKEIHYLRVLLLDPQEYLVSAFPA